MAAGSAALRLVKCHADAARSGIGVDANCVSAVNDRLSSAFTRAEANVCTSTGEVSVVSAALMALAGDLSATVGPGPSLCDSKKLLAAAKRAQATLSHALHRTRASLHSSLTAPWMCAESGQHEASPPRDP
jgi:hypothetical protein